MGAKERNKRHRTRHPAVYYLLDFDFKLRDGTWFREAEISIEGKRYKVLSKAAILWDNILQRTKTGSAFQKIKKSYSGVKLLFKDFQDFCNFCHETPGYNMKDEQGRNYALDKDLLDKENIIAYSRETCCFLPTKINSVLKRKKKDKKDADLPSGIVITKGKYRVRDGRGGRDYYLNTLEEAIKTKNMLLANRLESYLPDVSYDQRVVEALKNKIKEIS